MNVIWPLLYLAVAVVVAVTMALHDVDFDESLGTTKFADRMIAASFMIIGGLLWPLLIWPYLLQAAVHRWKRLKELDATLVAGRPTKQKSEGDG